MKRLLYWFLDLLYPPKCVFCERLLKAGMTDLCSQCRTTLPRAEGSVHRGEFYSLCQPVLCYEGLVAESLRRFKFCGKQHYASAYGRLLAMELLRARIEFDVLTWVPVSRKRRRKRGYDQARLLAEAVALELGVPCVQLLEKTRDNPAQSVQKDAAARKANVIGVYRPVQAERFSGKRVLLVDDIITTGATLSECSRVLRTAGAAGIVCGVLAATYTDAQNNHNSR